MASAVKAALDQPPVSVSGEWLAKGLAVGDGRLMLVAERLALQQDGKGLVVGRELYSSGRPFALRGRWAGLGLATPELSLEQAYTDGGAPAISRVCARACC